MGLVFENLSWMVKRRSWFVVRGSLGKLIEVKSRSRKRRGTWYTFVIITAHTTYGDFAVPALVQKCGIVGLGFK